jgi:hypothetical protein
MSWYVLVLVIVGVGGGLTACGGEETPTPPAPTISCVEAQFKHLRVQLSTPDTYQDEYGPLKHPDEWYLGLGHEPSVFPGAAIVGEANIPESSDGGYLEFVQNVSARVVMTFEDGSKSGFGPTAWSLDTKDPQDTYSLDDPPQLHAPCTPGTSCARFMHDPVLASLDKVNKFGSPLVRLERHDKFRTYLLWRPISCARIPLGVVEWSWHVFAQRDITNTGEVSWWVEQYATDPWPGEVKEGVSTSEMPVFEPNIMDNELKMLEPPHTPSP